MVSSKLAGEIRTMYESDAGVGGGSAVASAPSGTGGASSTPALASAGGTGGGAADEGTGGSSSEGSPEPASAGAGGSAAAGSAGAAGASGGKASCDGFAVLAANCGSSGCHGAGSNLESFAASEATARSFIGKAGTLACTGQGAVIDSDDPDESLMIRKLSDDPPCGQKMPLSGTTLSKSDIDCLRDWISQL